MGNRQERGGAGPIDSADRGGAGAPGKVTRTEQIMRRWPRGTGAAPALQARGSLAGDDAHDWAAYGVSTASWPLPHEDAIQASFGHHDVGGVRAQIGGAATEASAALGARAYATGDAVAFAAAPDLHLAAHEAAHVVQQRGGVRLSDGLGQAGDVYEQHADAVADLVVRGQSAASLLDAMAHRGASGGAAVQRADAAAPTTAAPPDPDRAIVANLIAGGQKDETVLTNAVFFTHHPELNGQNLPKGSPLIQEWLAFRDRVVRPALATPAAPAAPAAAPAAPAAAPPTSLAGQAAQALTDLVSSVVSAGSALLAKATSAVTSVSAWISGTTATPPADGATEVAPPPADAAPGGGAAAPGPALPAFANQRDNTFVGKAGQGEVAATDPTLTKDNKVNAGTECNITTLAMQLLTVARDEAKVRAACCENLERLGGTVSDADRASGQIEDLLLKRFFLPTWADGSEWRKLESQKPFWKGFADEVAGRKYHKNSLCINHVAGELAGALPVGTLGHDEAKDDADQARLLTPEYFKATFAPVIAGGGAVMLSTELTDGHIVLLAEVLADGITINDPYGMCLEKVDNARGYLRNGDPLAAGLKVRATYESKVATRAKLNQDPIASVVQGGSDPMPADLGKRNFYTWAEVTTYKIGKWNNTMQKA
jgi:Domain of unknown function (DUF4157)